MVDYRPMVNNIDQTALYRPITDHKSSLKRAYFQKAVTLFDFAIVMENLYSNHNICNTLLLYLGQGKKCKKWLKTVKNDQTNDQTIGQ